MRNLEEYYENDETTEHFDKYYIQNKNQSTNLGSIKKLFLNNFPNLIQINTDGFDNLHELQVSNSQLFNQIWSNNLQQIIHLSLNAIPKSLQLFETHRFQLKFLQLNNIQFTNLDLGKLKQFLTSQKLLISIDVQFCNLHLSDLNYLLGDVQKQLYTLNISNNELNLFDFRQLIDFSFFVKQFTNLEVLNATNLTNLYNDSELLDQFNLYSSEMQQNKLKLTKIFLIQMIKKSNLYLLELHIESNQNILDEKPKLHKTQNIFIQSSILSNIKQFKQQYLCYLKEQLQNSQLQVFNKSLSFRETCGDRGKFDELMKTQLSNTNII